MQHTAFSSDHPRCGYPSQISLLYAFMMAKRVAFMTIGALIAPMGEPEVHGFLRRVGGVFDAADRGVGLIARSERDMETLDHSWGNVEIPQCYLSASDNPLQVPSTLSLWEDLESVAAFSYHGAHGEAVSKRTEWFQKLGLPGYVAWWVDEDVNRLVRSEAAERLDHLYIHGPTPFAFNFRQPFDADGIPIQLDPALVRAKVAENKLRWG